MSVSNYLSHDYQINETGSVTDLNTGKKYCKDSVWTLRWKFAKLTLMTLHVGVLKIIVRTVGLISGDFFREGKQVAAEKSMDRSKVVLIEKDFFTIGEQVEVEGANSVKIGEKFFTIGKPVEVHTFINRWIWAKEVPWALVKNIAKIVTLPFASIALEFAAIYGLFCPYDGRRIYGDIEHMWSRHIIYPDRNDCFENIQLNGDYIAMCMQPSEVAESKWISRGFDLV